MLKYNNCFDLSSGWQLYITNITYVSVKMYTICVTRVEHWLRNGIYNKQNTKTPDKICFSIKTPVSHTCVKQPYKHLS